ncbi:MAG: UDP-2,4-diacetamido-2,4,6-trideoxy-beta-L-altropyranose hydrolase [Rhodospirillales bacterium]|nr:MAG: UDP-2,4-diacetamido-2,4,6-trideoxy-beta-L-altropyranose hydrolase [Rhodospirillales bacterium]
MSLAVIRADASPDIGGGHVIRSMALAEGLQREGWEVTFACRAPTMETVPFLSKRHGIASLETSAGEEPAELRNLFPKGVDLLVVDHYERDYAFETALSGWARQRLVIEDLPGRCHDCEFLLDQNRVDAEILHRPFLSSTCRILGGPNFALLRSGFSRQRFERLGSRFKHGHLSRVIVLAGLTDSAGLLPTLIERTASLFPDVAIDAVLGSHAGTLDQVLRMASDLGQRLSIHIEPPDVSELMAAADMMIGAAGSSCWEACSLGLPMLLVETAENQRPVIEALTGAGAAIALGRANDRSSLRFVQGFEAAGDIDRRRSMAEAAFGLCDGLGAARVCLAMTGECAKDSLPVMLRPATEADTSFVFELQSEPGMRAYFREPCPPKQEEHISWFSARIIGRAGPLSIIEYDGVACGLIRLDRNDQPLPSLSSAWIPIFEISILVSSRYQRNGIGLAALKSVRRLLPFATFIAQVLEGNTASHHLFSSAGFERVEPTWYISLGHHD